MVHVMPDVNSDLEPPPDRPLGPDPVHAQLLTQLEMIAEEQHALIVALPTPNDVCGMLGRAQLEAGTDGDSSLAATLRVARLLIAAQGRALDAYRERMASPFWPSRFR